jgi:hypothetical protein
MNRLLTFALAAATLAAAVVVVATSSLLPDRVATHFAMGGRANGWMTHDGYVAFALAFNVLMPWLVFVLAAFVPPKRSIALAGDDARAAARSYGAAIGLLIAVLATAMHFVLIDANAKSPPALDERLFFGVLVAFVVGLAALAIGYARRFPRQR